MCSYMVFNRDMSMLPSLQNEALFTNKLAFVDFIAARWDKTLGALWPSLITFFYSVCTFNIFLLALRDCVLVVRRVPLLSTVLSSSLYAVSTVMRRRGKMQLRDVASSRDNRIKFVLRISSDCRVNPRFADPGLGRHARLCQKCPLCRARLCTAAACRPAAMTWRWRTLALFTGFICMARERGGVCERSTERKRRSKCSPLRLLRFRLRSRECIIRAHTPPALSCSTDFLRGGLAGWLADGLW